MFGKSKLEIVLPCSIEQACRRLAAKLDTSLFGPRPVVGRLRGTRLTARKRIGYRNSFQTYLSADLIDLGNETLCRCRFSMHPLVIAFATVWFAIVVLAGGAVSIEALIRLGADRVPISGLLVPVEMILGGAALLAFGRWLARDEAAFLIDFIRAATADAADTLDPPRADHIAR